MRFPTQTLRARFALPSMAALLLLASPALAQEADAPAQGKYTQWASGLGYPGPAQPETVDPTGAAPAWEPQPQPAPKAPRSWGTGNGKSLLVPALEIPAFLTLLSVYDRHAYPDQMQDGKKVYSSTFSSTWDHLTKQHWVIDQDPFAINQFMHPYQGSIFHGFARSAGLNYWEAFIYDNMGSFEWKMAGETDPPSINDQIATGIAGSFFGEALFRMANLMFEADEENPSFLRKVAGTLVSPSAGFNR